MCVEASGDSTHRKLYASLYGLFRVSLCLLLIITLCSCSKQQNIRYEIIDIDPSRKICTYGEAYSINENGDVAGICSASSGKLHLFCWDAEKKTVICGTEVGEDNPVWIDNQQNIIYQKSPVALWNPSMGREMLLASNLERIHILGLNNKNQALLGQGGLSSYDTLIWDISENKCVQKIDNFLGKTLNDKGTIAGAQSYEGTPHAAILWGDGKISVLDDSPEEWSWATDINEKNEVIGWLKEYNGMSFVWSSDKGLRKLGYIQDRHTFFNGGRTKAYSINNKGQVVGWSSYGTVKGPLIWPIVFRDDGRAFYWDERNGMVDLNQLVNNLGDWERLVEAFGINDKGQIVGWGFKKGADHKQPFLLTPLIDSQDKK